MSEINLQLLPQCCGNCTHWDGVSSMQGSADCLHKDNSYEDPNSVNVTLMRTTDMSICTRWKLADR